MNWTLRLSKVCELKTGAVMRANGLRRSMRIWGLEYDRVRLGIGHPGHTRDRVAGYVLHDLPKRIQEWLRRRDARHILTASAVIDGHGDQDS